VKKTLNAKSISRLKPRGAENKNEEIKYNKFNNFFAKLEILMLFNQVWSIFALVSNLAKFLSSLHHMLLDSACNDSIVHANQQKVAPIHDETINIKSFTHCSL
jgi:hypothetical protein